ncbi:MAG TPA: hypothetical protein ENN39_01105 [Desulfonatronum sp.]|nr:hypothetical protein [Desulfonatronum sp.]
MKRKTLFAEVKAEAALDVLAGRKTTMRLAEKHGVHPATISRWKAKAWKAMVDVFRAGPSPAHSGPALEDQGKVGSGLSYVPNTPPGKRGDHTSRDAEELAESICQAAGAIHEINNSLGIVLCYAQLLLKEIPTGDPIAQDVAVIEKHARNCKRIATELQACAKKTKA